LEGLSHGELLQIVLVCAPIAFHSGQAFIVTAATCLLLPRHAQRPSYIVLVLFGIWAWFEFGCRTFFLGRKSKQPSRPNEDFGVGDHELQVVPPQDVEAA
jgi:hypothetical protein